MANNLKIVLLALMALLVGCSSDTDQQTGESGFEYRDGIDFQTLARPVATDDPTKIELAEIYWYGCIHCYNFEPYLKEFVADLPEDVNLVKVPVAWNATAELHAKIYYAAEALGITDEIHDEVFVAMNKDKKPLASEEAILNLIEDLGQNKTAFQRAFNSFGVSSQVTQAKSRATAYGVRGTPELFVNGKYRIASTMAGSQPRMLLVAEALIQRERELLQSQQQ
jgi:protein dithiol oxidoreductase (disulfide-forming)